MTIRTTIIAIGVILALIAVWVSGWNFGLKLIVSGLLVAGGILEFVHARRERLGAERTRASGKLSVKETLFSPNAAHNPRLELADSGAILEFTGPQGTALFQIFTGIDLKIERDSGRVLVSTKIHDSRGTLVAEIERNEWPSRSGKAPTKRVKSVEPSSLPEKTTLPCRWRYSRSFGIPATSTPAN